MTELRIRFPKYDRVPDSEMLMVRGVELLRKIRGAVTQPGGIFTNDRYQAMEDILVTMETVIILHALRKKTHKDNLTTLLNMELDEREEAYIDMPLATIYGAADPLEACKKVYETVKDISQDPDKELAQILRSNYLDADPSPLFSPQTLVLAPLSSDRFFMGAVRRVLRSKRMDCFDLATIACSTDHRIVTHYQGEWDAKGVTQRENIYILQDNVDTKATAEALHKYVEGKTKGNIYSASRRTVRNQ